MAFCQCYLLPYPEPPSREHHTLRGAGSGDPQFPVNSVQSWAFSVVAPLYVPASLRTLRRSRSVHHLGSPSGTPCLPQDFWSGGREKYLRLSEQMELECPVAEHSCSGK